MKRMTKDANSKALQLTPKAKRRLGITMNIFMGFVLLGLILVAGLFGLLLPVARDVVA